MSELKDSFFMLFGKTIAFSPTQVSDANECVASDHNLSSASDSGCLHHELDRDLGNSLSIDQRLNMEPCKDKQEEATSGQISGKLKDAVTLASYNDNPKTPSVDLETSPSSKSESDMEGNTLKKPDKIVPCPRCNSMDTKFCYYNNYNVKQPRHFCKNCQRYWTAGGTMRSVPVGAGRRKNKNATASHYRHIMVSEALQMTKIRSNPASGNNASVLTFGSEIQNGFHRPDQRVLVPFGGKDNGDDHSSGCGSSITASSSSDKVDNSGLQEARVQDCQGFPPQVPCFPGPAWQYAWNSTLHPAAFSPVFYPAPPYWGCTVMGSWDMPHAPPPSMVLGKHLRDEKPANESNTSGRSVWFPNSSGGGLFKAFQPGNGKYQAVGAPAALRANPAALSRSLNFQEST